MAYNSKKPLLVWYRNDELCVYTDHWIKLENVLPNNEIISMAKAKLVWYKDGKLQTYSNKWEEIGEWPTPTPVHVTGVSLNESSASLQPEGTLQLVATVEPADATDKRVTWSSSNSAVASVNSQGLVTAWNTDGEAVITVKTRDGNFTATCSVTVSAHIPEVQEIALSGGQENIVWYANRWTWFGVKITPYTASNVHFTAVSSDPNVFEVTGIDYSEYPDEYQIGSISLRFVGEGEATLTLTSEDNPNVTASYPVIVNPDVRVASISNPSSLSAEAYAYGQKNNIITFNYSPTNAVMPNEDILCQLKEGETSIGYAWISKISDGVAWLNFSGEAPAGSSAVYELYAVDDPSSKYEITITLVEAVSSLTLSTNQLSMNAGESDVSVGFTYSPITADLDSVNIESRWFQQVELIKDSDGAGHLAITSDENQDGNYSIRLASSNWSTLDELSVNVQQVPVASIVSNIPSSFDLTDNGDAESYTVQFLPNNASNPIRDITVSYVSWDGDEVSYSSSVTAQGVLTLTFHCQVIGTYVYSLDLNGESEQQITINCVATPQPIKFNTDYPTAGLEYVANVPIEIYESSFSQWIEIYNSNNSLVSSTWYTWGHQQWLSPYVWLETQASSWSCYLRFNAPTVQVECVMPNNYWGESTTKTNFETLFGGSSISWESWTFESTYDIGQSPTSCRTIKGTLSLQQDSWNYYLPVDLYQWDYYFQNGDIAEGNWRVIFNVSDSNGNNPIWFFIAPQSQEPEPMD